MQAAAAASSSTDQLAGSTSSLPPRPPAAVLPAELEALLGPLAQARSVLGLLVLARAGSAAAAADAATAAHAPPPNELTSSDGGNDGQPPRDQTRASVPTPIEGPTIVQALGAPFEGDHGRAYALRVAGMVDAVEQGCVGKDGSGDPLKFLRIRTAKHELIITPDANYILVVLHDPAQ